MAEAQIPMLAWIAFGVAWIAGLSLFACLFVITRRLDMSWRPGAGGLSLRSEDLARVGKLLLGLERAPADVNVGGLIWAVRGCWAVMVVSIILFTIKLAGVA